MEYIALHLDGSERRYLICKLRGDATGRKRPATGGSHLRAGARSPPIQGGAWGGRKGCCAGRPWLCCQQHLPLCCRRGGDDATGRRLSGRRRPTYSAWLLVVVGAARLVAALQTIRGRRWARSVRITSSLGERGVEWASSEQNVGTSEGSDAGGRRFERLYQSKMYPHIQVCLERSNPILGVCLVAISAHTLEALT
jgi:hypothetical protein